MPVKKRFVIALMISAALPFAAMGQTVALPPVNAEVSAIGVMPSRGMSMEQVTKNFGEPTKKVAAIGKPPISRWIYDGFIVYFEGQHVIHALVVDDGEK